MDFFDFFNQKFFVSYFDFRIQRENQEIFFKVFRKEIKNFCNFEKFKIFAKYSKIRQKISSKRTFKKKKQIFFKKEIYFRSNLVKKKEKPCINWNKKKNFFLPTNLETFSNLEKFPQNRKNNEKKIKEKILECLEKNEKIFLF